MSDNYEQLNYSNIENPLNNQLERTGESEGFNVEATIGASALYQEGDEPKNINSPNEIGENVISGSAIDNVWIKSWIKSNNYKVGTTGFKIDGLTGDVEFGNGKFRGDITGATGTFGGSLIAGNIHIPDQDTTANSFHVQADADTWWGCTETDFNADNDNANAYILNTGYVKFQSGVIGGFTLGATTMYGGVIKTAETVEAGSTGVIIDTDGLRGYDSVLGNTFDLPTDGSAPTFSSGIINETIFEISTNAVLRTSSTVGDGTANSAGVLINDTGVYGCAANQTPSTANFRILNDGGGSIVLGTTGFVKAGQTDYATGTGFFLGYSSDDYKFSIGSSTNYLRWDGSYLTLKGSFDIGSTGVLNNSSYTVANLPIPPTTVGFNSPSAYE